MLRRDELAGSPTTVALDHLRALFSGSESLGAVMAGRAEELVGDPEIVAAASAALAADLLAALRKR